MVLSFKMAIGKLLPYNLIVIILLTDKRLTKHTHWINNKIVLQTDAFVSQFGTKVQETMRIRLLRVSVVYCFFVIEERNARKNLRHCRNVSQRICQPSAFTIHETLFCSRIRNWNFETSGILMFDKPKSKVALAAIKELSDKIVAADGASLQCQIWLLRSGGLAERF